MQKFISNKIDKIYNDFVDELSKKRYYCDLKTFRFDGNNIPDYNNQLIQRYYLLRYMPAYIIEYYYIYKKMFGFNFLDHNPNIISIGCGCGLDLWGAKFAKDESCPDIDIQYTGIDTIDWEYKDNLNIEETYFINRNINELHKLDKENYNIIVFPKSIGEFDKNTFLNLKHIIANTYFSEDKIILLSSIRKTRHDFDISRLKEVINIFTKEHSYACLDSETSYWSFKYDLGLVNIYSDFVYPEDIKNHLINLNNSCNGFIENYNQPCEDECKNMNKCPILTTSQIEYQILRLKRQE